MNAPIPNNDEARLEVLRQYEILDTADETAYDDLVNLAASVCGTPMAAISLVDEERQWFKARVGIGFRDTERDISICAHAIVKPDQTLIVPDTIVDERFSYNQLVISKPNIRFYVGVPLVNPEGFALGTLCVMDRDSRGISTTQIVSLQTIARQVVALLELRRTRIRLRSQADTLTRFNEAAPYIDSSMAALLQGIDELMTEASMSDRERRLVQKAQDSANDLHRILNNLRGSAKVEVTKTLPSINEMRENRPAVSMAPPPPVVRPDIEDIGREHQAAPMTAPISRRSDRPRVLVADDNEMNCIVLTSLLESNGCDVVCVENGEVALQKMATERFDLVFMDIQMPRLDGVQTTRTIRRMPYPICNVPIVALTATIDGADDARCRAAGMNDFISKPISERSVRQILSAWLVRSESSALI